MKDFKHYLFLATILSLGFGLFWWFNFNRQIQIAAVLLMAVLYIFWGVVHHLIKRDLHWRIILEYLVVASLASVVVIFLLMRA